MSKIALCSCQIASFRVILVFLSLGMYDTGASSVLTIVGIDEHIEGIIVEFKLLAVCLRHRAPYFQSTIVLVSLVVVTTVEAISGTVVGRYNICLDYSSQRRISSFVCFLLSLRHAVAHIDELSLAELYGACADECRLHIFISHRSCLCSRNSGANMQVFVTTCIFLSYDIRIFECSLSSRNNFRMAGYHCLVCIVNILGDEVGLLILALSENASFTASEMIGRPVFIACHRFILLFLICRLSLSFGVPCVPVCWVVNLVGEHIASVVAHIV